MNYLLKKTTGPARLKMPRRCWRKKKYTEGNALRPRLCRAGFTLIELLVVIAIIAILASILLPALRKSIKEAREVVCMNNIHQLCVAATTYKEDYYGHYPPASFFLMGATGGSANKEDYYGHYPPASFFLMGATGGSAKVHPECTMASDIGFIAPYIGQDPSRFSDTTELTETQYPAVMRCPFGKFAPFNGGAVNWYGYPRWNFNQQKVDFMYRNGYGYFGNLELQRPGYTLETFVPEAFKKKYASRNCDPDAALWGDAVAFINAWGENFEGYTHKVSGGVSYFWQSPTNYANFDRQNMGRVDGSVRARWPWEVNPNRLAQGVGLTWGNGGKDYVWWY